MAKRITISDHEPAYEWANKLVREADDGELFPPEYNLAEAEYIADQLAEQIEYRENQLLTNTILSEREAQTVAFKQEGLTHDGIAFVMTLTNERAGDAVSPSTVGEYINRARNKYLDAHRTKTALEDTFLAEM